MTVCIKIILHSFIAQKNIAYNGSYFLRRIQNACSMIVRHLAAGG